MNSFKLLLVFALVAFVSSQNPLNQIPSNLNTGFTSANSGLSGLTNFFSTIKNRLSESVSAMTNLFSSMSTLTTQIRDTLRQQGLSDEQIRQRFTDLAHQLQQAQNNGSPMEEMSNITQNFIKQNGLENLFNKYTGIIRGQIESVFQSLGLGKFINRVENFVNQTGGISPAIETAKLNYERAGGANGMADWAVQIASTEGPSSLQSRLNQLAEYWGLGDLMQQLINMVKKAWQSISSAMPFGQAFNLMSSLNPLPSVNGISNMMNIPNSPSDIVSTMTNLPNQITNAVDPYASSASSSASSLKEGIEGPISASFAGIESHNPSRVLNSNSRQNGFFGQTFGPRFESMARFPFDTSKAFLKPFSAIPGVGMAQNALSTAGQMIG